MKKKNLQLGEGAGINWY